MHKPISLDIHASGEGTQTIYKFPNGFGASVIKDTPFNHGKFLELGFLRFKDVNDYRGNLCVPDPFNEAVRPYLTVQEVEEWLDYIESLNPIHPYDLV